ncbi:MAG TPA: GntR family transcriptional regulator [Terriglobales bacterium]|nr:GntR family transcriptional regulator [Terriglobales bacterium]
METSFPQIGSSPAAGPSRASNLRTIPRVSLKDAAVQSICQAIESGELKAGEMLTELGLARKLGVGQPTIREALLELEFIGYVERTPTRKARVTLLTRRSIENIYLVRTRLETLAVELIAAQPAPQLESCKEPLQAMESAARNGVFREFCHADLKFHRALWASSQNDCIESSLERIVPKLFAFAVIRHSNPNTEQLMETYELHRRLLDAILQGNAAYARELMEFSMEQAWIDDAQLPVEDGL